MYKVSLEIIKKKMLAVLNDELTLEEASDWAGEVMRKREIDEVEIDPEEDVSLIFELLSYLLLMDLREPTGEYFYSIEDVQDLFQRFFPSKNR